MPVVPDELLSLLAGALGRSDWRDGACARAAGDDDGGGAELVDSSTCEPSAGMAEGATEIGLSLPPVSEAG